MTMMNSTRDQNNSFVARNELAEALLKAGPRHKIVNVLGEKRVLGFEVHTEAGECVARFYQPERDPKTFHIRGKRGKNPPLKLIQDWPADELPRNR